MKQWSITAYKALGGVLHQAELEAILGVERQRHRFAYSVRRDGALIAVLELCEHHLRRHITVADCTHNTARRHDRRPPPTWTGSFRLSPTAAFYSLPHPSGPNKTVLLLYKLGLLPKVSPVTTLHVCNSAIILCVYAVHNAFYVIFTNCICICVSY